MRIREVAPDEVAEVSRLTVEAYVHVAGQLLDAPYLAELADVDRRSQEAIVLVAVDGDGDGVLPVGAITYVGRPGPWGSIQHDDEAELRMLAVALEVQRRGVGAALVAACVDRARAEGKRRVVLHTMPIMIGAQQLYGQAGFHRAPELDHEINPDVLLLGYSLDLAGDR